MALDSLTSTMFRAVTDTRMTRVRDLAKQLEAPTAPAAKAEDRYGYVEVTRGADGSPHYSMEIGNRSSAYPADLARNLANGMRVEANERIEELKPQVERTDGDAEGIRRGEKWNREQLDRLKKGREIIKTALEQGYYEQVGTDKDDIPVTRKITGAELKEMTDNALKTFDRDEKQAQQYLDNLPEQWKAYEAKRLDSIKTTVEGLESRHGFKSNVDWQKDPAGDHIFDNYSLSFSFSVGTPAGSRFTAGYTQNNSNAALNWSTTVNGQTITTSYSGKAALAFLIKPYESVEMQKLYGRGSGPENHTGIDVNV